MSWIKSTLYFLARSFLKFRQWPPRAPSWNTIWHKHKMYEGNILPLVSYSQGSGGKQMAWTNFGGHWQELSPWQPIVGGINGAHIFQLPASSTCLATQLTSFANSLSKEVTLVPINLVHFDWPLSISSKTFKSYLIFLDEWPHVDHLASTECFDFNATH